MTTLPEDIIKFDRVGYSHVYLLASDGKLTLIDSGMCCKRVRARIEEEGYAVTDLKTIVLTHAHFDHTGCAAKLAKESGAKIVAHQDEAPYITREKGLPTPSPLKFLIFRLFNRVLPRLLDLKHERDINKVDRLLKEGDIVDALGGLQVLHVPGHTPGSIALYHPTRKILFCGDALTNKKKVRCSVWHASTDWKKAQNSARKLASYPAEVAYFGHGTPILEQAGKKIKEAIDQL
jgi:glyoxylase-like metal-dependent hydrolase (beta-lactamase superfamily II)